MDNSVNVAVSAGENNKAVDFKPALILAIVAAVFSVLSFSVSSDGSYGFGTVFSSFGFYMEYGQIDSLVSTLVSIATPILIAVFVVLFSKKNQWVALLPLALPFITVLISIAGSVLRYSDLYLKNPSYLFSWYGLPILIYGATIVAAALCMFMNNPRKAALGIFSGIAALSVILCIAGQQPFAFTLGGSYGIDASTTYYLGSLLRFLCILASACFFVLAVCKAEKNPLIGKTKPATASVCNYAGGQMPAPNSAMRLDAYLQASIKENPETSLDELQKLKTLLDSGALTQTEYDAKKKEILNRI